MALPSEPALRWLVSRYAQLRARHGSVLEGSLLVEPTGRFFPDPFAVSGEALLRLFRRVMSYAPLAEGLPVELALAAEDEGSGGGCGTGGCGPGGGAKAKAKSGCGTGACGPSAEAEDAEPTADPLAKSGAVVPLADGYGVVLRQADLAHPTLLTSALARAAGTIVLREAAEDVDPVELGGVSEIAAVATGLGVLLLGGSSVYAKACGGLREQRNTYLSMEELAVATALFCRIHGHDPGRVRTHLATTQREAFGEALPWVDSNDNLVAALRDTPILLADGAFTFQETKGWLARVLGRSRRPEPEAFAVAPRPRPVRSAQEERRLAEARALVEEALREGEA